MGTPIPIVLGDKTYKLGPPTRKLRHDMENWLEEYDQKRMASLVEKRRAFLGDDDGLQAYKLKLWEEHQEKVAAGKFKLTAITEESGLSEDGGRYFFYLMISKNHPEVTLEQTDEMMDNYPVEITSKMQQFGNELKALVDESKKRNQPGRSGYGLLR